MFSVPSPSTAQWTLGNQVHNRPRKWGNSSATTDQRILKRAGFYRNGVNEGREFLVLPETFRQEVCQGFDEKTVKKVLIKAGLLLPGNDKKPSQVVRLPGLGSSRVYVIRYRDEEE
jgi:putative DNA primase/helicase